MSSEPVSPDACTSTPTQYWKKTLLLESEDKAAFVGGEWLRDKHVHAAQTLLRMQLPNQNVLQCALALADKLRWSSQVCSNIGVVLIFCPSLLVCVNKKMPLYTEMNIFPLPISYSHMILFK